MPCRRPAWSGRPAGVNFWARRADGFDHHAEDVVAAGLELGADVARATSSWRRCCLLLLACEQSTIRRPGSLAAFEVGAGGGHAFGVIVGRLAAAQDDVAVPLPRSG